MSVYHNLPHWNYYLLLERDLEDCFRFVNPSEEHWEVYSDIFARIILMAATEVENAFKSFSSLTPSNPSKIREFFDFITPIYPNFCDMKMEMPRYSIKFKPWDHWSNSNPPDWWTGYNKIKHHRLRHPNAPTLKRAIYSVGALQVLLLHFYRYKYNDCHLDYSIKPNLIIPLKEESEWKDAEIFWGWKLPDEPVDLS